MADPNNPPTAPDQEFDEWEVVNDDGFVYKRKKRRLDPTVLARPPDPALDQAAEERKGRKRKRKALLKIKEKYEKEIGLWEQLSNTLKAMDETVKSKLEQRDRLIEDEKRESGKGQQDPEVVQTETSTGSWVSEVLLQVEVQLEIIHNFSCLCDVAESLCNAQEEKSKESFFDLPIWGSPHELMASLCEDRA